jgi:hypothetical protein
VLSVLLPYIFNISTTAGVSLAVLISKKKCCFQHSRSNALSPAAPNIHRLFGLPRLRLVKFD